MKSLICRIFHLKHWKVYHVRKGENPYIGAVCSKCYSVHEIKPGKEISEKLQTKAGEYR